ncbi:MAG: GNAT family N-acetyltransferase [Dehalococcoidia bacterium]
MGDVGKLRRATECDAESVATVHMAARRAAMPFLPELHSEAETIRYFTGVVIPTQQVWVVDREGQVAGFAAVDEQFLEHLYVHPARQGQGIGSALLNKAIEVAGETLDLWVFQRNEAARRFYERRGFELVRTTDGAGNEEKAPDALYRWTKGRSSNT